MKIWTLLFIILAPRLSGAAVVYDNSAQSICGTIAGATACGGGGLTLTYSLTVGSGSNRALAVFISIGTGCGSTTPSISSVTYAGVALSQVRTRSQTSCTGQKIFFWALPAGTQPASGANNVVVTMSGTLPANSSLHSGAFSASMVDQASNFTSSNDSEGNSGTSSVTLSASGADDLGVSYVCNGNGLFGATQTQVWLDNFTNGHGCGSYGGSRGAGGVTTFTWTINSDVWLLSAAAFKAWVKPKRRVIAD